MHKADAQGFVEYSECDFCRARADDLAMIEGHQGSLICTNCLAVAYSEVVLAGVSTPPGPDLKCTMCLEVRNQPHWTSPAVEGSAICLRCIRQGATTLEKDKELGWKRPG